MTLRSKMQFGKTFRVIFHKEYDLCQNFIRIFYKIDQYLKEINMKIVKITIFYNIILKFFTSNHKHKNGGKINSKTQTQT